MTDRKVALITGSGTGVGAATALMLARRGYNVLINYSRSEAEARASQAACVDAGADTLLMQGDVAEDADCRALVSGALARWGRIDALVNNAGVSTFTGAANWDVLDTATFQRIFAVNALGAFQMVRACRPLLEAAEKQRARQEAFVNVSGLLSPAIVLQKVLSDVAGTGATRHQNFVRQFDEYVRRRNQFFAARVFQGQPITSTEISDSLKFVFHEEGMSKLLQRVTWPLLLLLLLPVSLMVWGIRIYRKPSLTETRNLTH